MKPIVRNMAINAFALSILPGLLSGVHITGGLLTLLIGGLVLSIMNFTVRPVLHIFTLPLNFMTFGMFSFVINVILLYLLTVFIPQISVSAFVYKGLSFFGFVIPRIDLNTITAYFLASFVLSGIEGGVKWLIAK